MFEVPISSYDWSHNFDKRTQGTACCLLFGPNAY